MSNEAILVQDVEQTVKQNGFAVLRTRTDELLMISIETAFEMFGEDCARALLFQLCIMHKMSHEELLSRYDLIEKSLKTVFGFGSEAITTYIRANFLKNLGLQDSGQSLKDLLKKAKEKEVSEFVLHISAGQHVALVHSDEELAQKLCNAFLESGKGSKGVLAGSCSAKDASVMRYDNLYGFDDEAASKRILNWMRSVKASGPKGEPATIASEAGLFLGNGLAETYMALDRSIGPNPEETRMLCCYNVAKLRGREHVLHICETHSHVILGDSFVVYRRKAE